MIRGSQALDITRRNDRYLNNHITCTGWDPLGSGPAPNRIFVGSQYYLSRAYCVSQRSIGEYILLCKLSRRMQPDCLKLIMQATFDSFYYIRCFFTSKMRKP